MSSSTQVPMPSHKKAQICYSLTLNFNFNKTYHLEEIMMVLDKF